MNRTKELLTEILKVLQRIENHLAPKIWINPPYDGTGGDSTDDSWRWRQSGDWTEIQHEPLTDTAGCGCEKCRPPVTAGGCRECGCKYVAVYNEDGTWLCNKCK